MAHAVRPMRDGDWEFLVSLYASTRADELSRTGWTDEQKDVFIRMQFDAQTKYYAQVYPDMEYAIITHDGADAGRLIVAELEDEFRIVDIALMPAHRGAGIGTALITEVFERARTARKAVRIHVEVFNPAKRLYERLGFTEIENKGVYLQMEWRGE